MTTPVAYGAAYGVLASVFSGCALATPDKADSLGSGLDLSGVNKPTAMQGALASLSPNMTRRLHLVNAHTGDDFQLAYFRDGKYVDESISRLNHLMRDRRANLATNMDTTLYDQLFLLRDRMGIDRPIHVLSGYRTPETNAKLRRRMKRVAKYSLHMEGRAADIFVPGIPVEKLQQAALSLSAGGVGVYSSSHFIHMDTGPVRHWGK
ncbi:MAG: DUF882 domain-containing protein [Granulosicoccus sp.]